MVNLNTRSELLFLYDVKDANPNGDPLDENKPRIDEETNINLVTDVRLKRTIRDYLYNFKEKEIFIREIEYEKGKIQTGKLRAEDFLLNEDGSVLNKKGIDFPQMKAIIEKNICERCIDVRLFGATIPIEKDTKNKGSITYTGPVQFKMGRSLHKVFTKHLRGTGAFASKEDATQKTFRDETILLYSLISFYGVINENAARWTQLTQADIELLLDAMWNGTKNLISRSKVGQMPRLLLKVNYSKGNYHIGDLNALVKLQSSLEDEEIRDISEVTLEISELLTSLKVNKGKIKDIDYCLDTRLQLQNKGETVSIEECASLVDIQFNNLNC